MRTFLFTTLFLIAACTKAEPAPESAACCTNETTTAAGHNHAPAQPSNNAAAPKVPDLGPGDVLVSGRVTREGVVLSVQNHAPTQVKLKSTVRVEHHASDRWVPVVATGLALRFACDAEPTACVTLAPGGELLPPLWPALAGRGACGECADCPAIAPGDYRFVVEACEGNGTIASDAFTVNDPAAR